MRRLLAVLAALTFLISLSSPAFAKDNLGPDQVKTAKDAAYRLFLRVVPPGARQFQTFAFCSSSFYKTPEKTEIQPDHPKSTYGTTAGHCLAFYEMIRELYEERVWGLELQLVFSPDGKGQSFTKLHTVDYGMKRFVEWRECEEKPAESRKCERPNMDQIDDWAVIRADSGVQVDTVDLADSMPETGEQIYSTGFPMGLDQFWTQGAVTKNYAFPGTPYDGYLASDFTGIPGQSGSVVVNMDGKQIGILVAGVPGLVLSTPITEIAFPHEAESQFYGGKTDYRYYGSHGVQDIKTSMKLLERGQVNIHNKEFFFPLLDRIDSYITKLQQPTQ